MDARFYNSEEIDLERLANDIENMYRMQGFEVQQIGNKDQMMVQLKKGGDLVMLIGLQAALSVILQHTAGGTIAMIGQQKWLDKAAVGAVGLVAAPVLWPLMITAGAGAVRQASLGNQVLNVVDGLIRQQYPRVQVGPVPVHVMPQLQQQWAPPSSVPVYVPSAPQYVPSTAKGTLLCPNCNTPYEEGDTYCSGCGRSLAPKKTLCPNCKAEIKPGLAFCPNCGSEIAAGGTCAKCAGNAQPAAPVASAGGLTDNVAGMLAYVTIIPAILFLVLEPFEKRRHLPDTAIMSSLLRP